MEVVVFVNCIIGYMKSGDQLVGKFGSHHRGQPRIHRACDCPFELSADVEHKCQFCSQKIYDDLSARCSSTNGRLMHTQDAKSAKHQLDMFNQHRILDHAMKGITFGGDPYGMAAMQPGDLMHYFLNGMLQAGITCFINYMTLNDKSELDEMVLVIASLSHQTEARFFPKTGFSHGITNLSLITAEEWIGVCFTLMLISFDCGWLHHHGTGCFACT